MGMVRASFGLYTTFNDIDILVASLLNIIDITRNLYGEEAAEYIKNNYNYLDFLFHLASKYETKLLPGKGFGTINWITRVSLANLRADSYKIIGRNIRKTIYDMVNDKK